MSDPLVERDRAALGAPGKLRFHPMAVVRGEGAELIEPGGRRVLDFSAGWAVASLGYGDPALVEAVERATREMAGVGSLSLVSRPAVELAEALLETVERSAERRVWFGHSGTDGCDMALRLVTSGERKGVISFKGAYHGGFGGGMAISGHAALSGAGSHPGLFQLDYPEDEASGAAVLAGLEAALARLSFAALFVEPILSDGGLIVPPPGFLAGVAERCREHGVLVVCDEVKVGIGRTGRFHAYQWEGIDPDLIVLGKGLGGGLPISAVIGPARLMDALPSGAMLTTQGNPVATTAALAVVRAVVDRGLAEQAERVGARLRSRLEQIAAEQPLVREVRGRGLVIGVELAGLGGRSSAENAHLVCYRAWELGLLFYYVGGDRKVLELTPPLTLTEAEAERGAGILARALADAAEGRVDAVAAGEWGGW